MRRRVYHGLLLLTALWALGCARPFYWGSVTLRGLKGACHVLSHVDEHHSPIELVKQRLALAVDAGTEATRGPHVAPWALHDHPERIRQVFNLIEDHGLIAVPVLTCPPRMSLADWRQHCRTAAHLLPARFFSVMNEPDNDPNWPPDRYAKYLHVAATEIRAVRPLAYVCAPSLGHGKSTPPESFLPRLNPADYDILTVHLYQKGGAQLKRCLDLVPHKMVWVEEDGATGPFAAAALRGSYREYLQHPRVTGLFWYCMHNPDDPDYSMLKLEKSGTQTRFKRLATYRAFKAIR